MNYKIYYCCIYHNIFNIFDTYKELQKCIDTNLIALCKCMQFNILIFYAVFLRKNTILLLIFDNLKSN